MFFYFRFTLLQFQKLLQYHRSIVISFLAIVIDCLVTQCSCESLICKNILLFWTQTWNTMSRTIARMIAYWYNGKEFLCSWDICWFQILCILKAIGNSVWTKIELKVEINVSQSHLKFLCKCSSYVFLGQYLPSSTENNEECCGKNEESQQFHCKLRHLKHVCYRCYFMRDITCCLS